MLTVTASSGPSSVPEYKYVRTDSRVTTLDAFVYNNNNNNKKPDEMDTGTSSRPVTNTSSRPETNTVEVTRKPRVEVRLTSVLQLRKQIRKQENTGSNKFGCKGPFFFTDEPYGTL